jgi:hypothetical protein
VDDIIQFGLKTVQYIGDFFKSIWSVIRVARVPPDYVTPAAEQMKINYKAVAVSMILLFLARALQGHLVNDPSGSIVVVVTLVAGVVCLKFLSDAISRLARRLGLENRGHASNETSSQWATLIVSMWAWALFILVLLGLAHNYLGTKDLALYLRSTFIPALLVAFLSLLIVCIKTKFVDAGELGTVKQFLFYSIVSTLLVAVALQLSVFARWG